MWNDVYEQTKMEISDIDDAHFQDEELRLFLELVRREIIKSKSIDVDKWTFNIRTNYSGFVDDIKYGLPPY